MQDSTAHQGGCLCGAVRFEVRGTPKRVGACHCRYCQLRSGSAFGVSVYFPHEDVTVLQGELKSYAYQTESGNTTENQFCTECGSNVLWKSVPCRTTPARRAGLTTPRLSGTRSSARSFSGPVPIS